MRQPACFQAAIEIIELFDKQDRPASAVTAEYLRSRRYVGAKDRKNIQETLFSLIRNRYFIEWQFSQIDVEYSARALAFAYLIKINESLDQLNSYLDGAPYSPAPLSPTEHTWVTQYLEYCKRPIYQPPLWVQGNYPQWLENELLKTYGSELIPEMQAFDSNAPMDLRVNTTKTTRSALLKKFQQDGIQAQPTKYAKNGIRVLGRPALLSTKEYRQGKIEIQDEGSQIITELVSACSNHHIVDFCAGAGGKSLALAEKCAPNGKVISCDTSQKRLNKIKPRLARSGLKNIEIKHLEKTSDWQKAAEQTADRVLVDTPCSGTGTWRRDPDARTRLTEKSLADYKRQQSQILDEAAPLVKQGGRLVYATCSILASENLEQVENFVQRQKMFRLLPIGEIWRKEIGNIEVPTTNTLQLTPKQHAVDGFYIAIFERI